MDTLYTEFNKNSIRERCKDYYVISCVKGLWSVTAPTEREAEKEAFSYFVQYYSDGEYGCNFTHIVTGIDTDNFTTGTKLYLDINNPGNLTMVEP